MTATLESDLRTRWRPSDEQIAAADAAGGDSYTLHLLVNKHLGWWTEDVQIIPLHGLWRMADDYDRAARDRALNTLDTTVAAYRREHPGVRVSGGYTWHRPGSQWSVFEGC